MKPGLQIGDTYELELTVDESMRARFGTIVIHNLYSTAAMLTHMEWASRQHILPYLEEGEEGVGYQTEIKHLNPTPVGALVKIKSTVTAITEKQIHTQVAAWNEKRKIGEGVFVQALVSLNDLRLRYEDVPVATEAVLRPAVLWSEDFKSSFSLVLKCFEHNFPCTRYDEWFICVGELSSPDTHVKHEGPFLLKYETEDLVEQLKALCNGEKNEFKSEFLEPILSMRVAKESPRLFRLDLGLKQRDDEKHKDDFELVTLSMACTMETLQQFYRALGDQLQRFDSNL